MQLCAAVVSPFLWKSQGATSGSQGSLLNKLIRPQQQRWRNREAERLGGLHIDDKLELRQLLDREIGRFRALEDLVDASGAPSCRARRGAEGT